MRAGEHLAPILGDKDQMGMEFKNAVLPVLIACLVSIDQVYSKP